MSVARRAALLAGGYLLASSHCAVAGEPLTMSLGPSDAAISDRDDNASAPPPGDAEKRTVSDQELAATRGGETLVLTDQTLQSLVSSNTINGDYQAGDINISEGALSEFTGLGNLVFNTGAQSSLQAGMSVTINVSGEGQ